MKISISPFYLFMLCPLLLLFVQMACRPESQWKAEADALTSSYEAWQAKFNQVNHRIDSLWDSTSQILSRELPADFPEVDRDIFIKARNADHIRMFMSWELCSDSIKHVVNTAGERDAALAGILRQLLADKNKLDDSISTFLLHVISEDVDLGRQYGQHFAQLDSIAFDH